MSGKVTTQRISADEAGVAKAVRMLRKGALVALPTETVYGLAARADDEAAVRRIFVAKGRPSFNPLIVHIADLEQAERLAVFNEVAYMLAAKFWPGPLTLVLPKRPAARIAALVTAGLPTLALRVPAHPVMRAVLEQSGLPLAAPSANRSGSVSPTSADQALHSLEGRIDALLDAGPSECGLESTIVAVRADGQLEELRPGPLDLSSFAQKLRGATSPEHGAVSHIEAPGQLASHYSPGKPLRLNAEIGQEGEFFIGFGSSEGNCSLSPSGSLEEAAANLYTCLHLAAASNCPRIAVAPVPQESIGRAINDRLRRAAA